LIVGLCNEAGLYATSLGRKKSLVQVLVQVILQKKKRDKILVARMIFGVK